VIAAQRRQGFHVMRKKLFASSIALMSLVFVNLASPASAQERSIASYATEVSAGYSILRDVGENSKAGMVVDFGRRLNDKMSVIGEVAMNHFSYWPETYFQVAGGVRVGTVATGRVRPYAQFMVGMQREFGESGIVLQPGAGLNIRVARSLDAKVQVDLPVLRWDNDTYKQFRLTVGVGIPLGAR